MERRFSTAEVKKAIGVSTAFMKGLTRTTDGKRPLFTPSFPATSSGKKDFYSFADLMVLKVIRHLRILKLSRDWIDVILSAADEWRRAKGPESPFHEEFNEQHKRAHDFLVVVRLISVPADIWENFFQISEAQVLIEVSSITKLSKEAAKREGIAAAIVTPSYYTSTRDSLSRLDLGSDLKRRSEFRWEMQDIEELVDWRIHVSSLRQELDAAIRALE